MPVAPSPAEIYRRAVAEGERRLAASPLELVATGFNAGFTIVFGIAALGIVHGLVDPAFGPGVAKVAGAGAFALGLVALVVSRAELFTEDFFDPVATALDRRRWGMVRPLLRLWAGVLVLNLVGGTVLVLVLSVDGVMPADAERALRSVAEEIGSSGVVAALASAFVGGALVTLLSFLLQAVDQVLARMVAAYVVGFLLAVGPFAHVVVTFLHLVFGMTTDAAVGAGDVAVHTGVSVVGNLVGGVGFVTLAHVAQARGSNGGT